LSYNVAETMTIAFTSGSLAGTNSSNIVVSPAAVSKLGWTTQPGGARVGAVFTTQPVLKSQDAFGNASTNGLPASKPVTISLSSGTGPLLGTTSVDLGAAANKGVFNFSDLRIDTAGTNEQLTASAGGLTSAVSATFSVAKGTQTISFGSLANKTYGDSPFALSATASSGLAVSFAILSGPAGVSGSTLTITGAGTVSVQAIQSGDTNWNAASATQSFAVAKALLGVTADNKSRSYGSANPAFTASYSGFVNGETLATSGVTGSPSLSTTATTNSSVAGSPYPITPATELSARPIIVSFSATAP
jgi:hypothetical protein